MALAGAQGNAVGELEWRSSFCAGRNGGCCRCDDADGEPNGVAVIEVVLRNGRILRLPERMAPENAARVADALEAGGR